MAVLSFIELWEGRGGTGSWPNRRTYTRAYQARSSIANEASNTVVNAIGIRQGSRHPEDLYAYCVEISPRQEADDPTLWRVDYRYDSHPDIKTDEPVDPATGDAPQPKDNPLAKPAVWKYGFEKVTKVVTHGVDKKGGYRPIWNSAGMPFDPPVTIERARPTVTLTLNRPTFSMTKAAEYMDAVNDAPWRGMGTRTVRVTQIDAQSGFENGVSYVAVSYTLSYERLRWDVEVLDAGLYQLVPAAGGIPAHIERIQTPAGFTGEAVPLDGNGRPLPPGATAQFDPWRVYPERDFTKLFF